MYVDISMSFVLPTVLFQIDLIMSLFINKYIYIYIRSRITHVTVVLQSFFVLIIIIFMYYYTCIKIPMHCLDCFTCANPTAPPYKGVDWPVILSFVNGGIEWPQVNRGRNRTWTSINVDDHCTADSRFFSYYIPSPV